MKRKSVLLIDDHPLVRSGIAMVLGTGLQGISTQESNSLEEALALDSDGPVLVLLDLQLQGVSGIEGIPSLKRKWPQSRIVIVSAFAQADAVALAMERGAVGFISKTERPDRLLQLIEALLADDCPDALGYCGRSPERPKLTPRQVEVLDLLTQGLSNKMIGRRMSLSEHTVRGHVQAMLATLKVSSRSEAIYAARRLGLVQ